MLADYSSSLFLVIEKKSIPFKHLRFFFLPLVISFVHLPSTNSQECILLVTEAQKWWSNSVFIMSVSAMRENWNHHSPTDFNSRFILRWQNVPRVFLARLHFSFYYFLLPFLFPFFLPAKFVSQKRQKWWSSFHNS